MSVWQHRSANGTWNDFPEEINVTVANAYHLGAANVNFMLRGKMYNINFQEGKQRCMDDPTRTRMVRRLDTSRSSPSIASSGNQASSAASGSGDVPVLWQFEKRHGSDQWQDFPKTLTAAIEGSYQKGVVQKMYNIRGEDYAIDFRSMKQSCVLEPHRSRKVKRVSGPGAASMVPDPLSTIWYRLATMDEDVSTEDKVLEFFKKRQQGNPILTVAKCTRVENDRLRAFVPEPGHYPSLIFHGAPEALIGNIMSEGLLMQFCGGCGGIFGAPNPQTSLGYARKAGGTRHFMMVCLYDLATPLNVNTSEYNVPKDSAATVLWLLKLA